MEKLVLFELDLVVWDGDGGAVAFAGRVGVWAVSRKPKDAVPGTSEGAGPHGAVGGEVVLLDEKGSNGGALVLVCHSKDAFFKAPFALNSVEVFANVAWARVWLDFFFDQRAYPAVGRMFDEEK